MQGKKTEESPVPIGWRLVRLGDVTEILDSKRIPLNSDDRAVMAGPYPYYGANGVVDFIDRWIFDESQDLILLAEDGGHFDEFATRPIAYRVNGKCWVNNHTHVLKAKEADYESFIFHSLVNKDVRLFINGTTRSKLTQADLREIAIGFPPLPEQRAIAAVLDSIDDAIEGAEAVIAATERLRGALLHELLTRGVPGWHTAWREAPGVGSVPADWEVVRLGEVAEVAFVASIRKQWLVKYLFNCVTTLMFSTIAKSETEWGLWPQPRPPLNANDGPCIKRMSFSRKTRKLRRKSASRPTWQKTCPMSCAGTTWAWLARCPPH